MNPIQALIAERGPVSFRDFMELALYHPEHGYYASGRASVGRTGDYFTSVSVGPLFGQLLAAQFNEMWERLGRPVPFTIVEQGANDGAFASDVLKWCRAELPQFFGALRYVIVEPFEILRARQRERFAELGSKIVSHINLENLPPFTGVHFSNELIDAFPVHMVRFSGGQWREFHVTPELKWQEKPVKNAGLLDRLAGVPQIDGYTTEVNLAALEWAKTLAAKIERGWVLAIDYGFPRERYYLPERSHGSLQCYAGHTRGLDPLANPGYCDITAHVEFTSLAGAFLAAGMELAGFTDQHHFLTGLITHLFPGRTPTLQEARALKTLLHPEMLGTSFQVLCLSRATPGPNLAGFQFACDPLRKLGL